MALLTSARRWGGTTLSYTRMSRGLAQRGHQVMVLARTGEIAGRIRAGGSSAAAAPGALALWRQTRRFGPDAVLADLPRDLRVGALPGLGDPALVYRYNRTETVPRPGPVDRLLAGRVAACIFQSAFAARQAAAHEPWLARRPSSLVPNGYDVDRFAPDPSAGLAFRRSHGIGPEAAVVLTLAELARDKGHGDALGALGRVTGGRSGLVYLAVGVGPLEPELRLRAVAERVQFVVTGWLEGDELVAALNAADLVLHPSLHEICPNAVGEAMACARAVVATNVGGTPELVGTGGETGVLVPPADPAALAAAVTALLADPRRRAALGGAARRRIAAEFPLDRMVAGIEAALGAAVAAR